MVLAAACTMLDADGTICGTIAEIAERAGLSAMTTKRALSELRAAGLIHVHGQTRLVYRYVDPRVRKALQQPAGKRTDAAGWRELRARVGGLERALRDSLRKERAARTWAEELQARPADASRIAGDDAAIDAHLRAESLHALACLDGPDHCDRCATFKAVLDEDTRDEAAAAARLRLDEADDITKAARAVIGAFRAGDAAARARALGELERLVEP